jgi:hypothetical protein
MRSEVQVAIRSIDECLRLRRNWLRRAWSFDVAPHALEVHHLDILASALRHPASSFSLEPAYIHVSEVADHPNI